ncbi:class I SAM-dependent DNA methyltransferase [Endozoicomonas sp. ONNA1]|uniref:HsdM family class I SAM-dependent methyltransferase n=1 Tax=Endozoicomonas sp. ONNA1 TaxID=2828740 RepID=UPI002147F649|nr:SAM-dependent methyltransferase [Endozoicomonas sp. ONNA1]
MKKQLIELLDTARGHMEPEHLIELLSFLCLIAKEAPCEFEATLKLEFAQHYKELEDLGLKLSEQQGWPEGIGQAPDINKLNSDVMSQACTLTSELKDYSIFSQILETVTERMGKKGWSCSSNQTTLTLFSILVGNCSQKTLYSGAAGPARLVSALNPEYALLEENHRETWIIAYRLLLLENHNFELLQADSLSHDLSNEHQADIVVMEPPFGLRFSADQRRSLAKVNYLKVPTGNTLPASAGDALWIQKAISMLKPEGKAYLLLPQGWLFRGGYDAKVRDYLLENGLVEAIIGLPSGILDSTAIPPALLILNKGRSVNAPVIFVDASEIGTKSRRRHSLSNDDARLIKELLSGKQPNDSRYKTVELTEIAAQGNTLSIQKYIQKQTETEQLSVKAEFAQLAVMQKKYDTARKKLARLLKDFESV